MADPQVNFFSSTLVGTYSASDTSLTIATGSGANLPDPSVDGEFNLVIYNESEIGVVTTYDGGSTDTREDLAGTNPEIVRVTARSGDVLTVTRGQEGTTASVKEEGNTYRVILSATKKVFDDIQTAIDNVNVTDLTGVESLVFDTTGDEEFGLPVGTTAQRPASPSQGYMRYNTSDGIGVEVYNGSRWVSLGAGFAQLALEVAQAGVTANDGVAKNLIPLEVEYLVIAGGGSGPAISGVGVASSSGAGAGGYRSSVVGESSGGGANAETILTLSAFTNYTVTVGAGAAPSSKTGSDSVFSTITSTGGGGGAKNGGSGGGSWWNVTSIGLGTAGQGYNGGTHVGQPYSGGGGGAGAVGGNATSSSTGSGGDGVQSSITGTTVYRAGGGGGGYASSANGGQGGGGTGSIGYNVRGNGGDGSPNTGGGGGGVGVSTSAGPDVSGGSGGSGVVILRYPSDYSITVGAGLTASTATVGANKVTTFTAGTGTISFS